MFRKLSGIGKVLENVPLPLEEYEMEQAKAVSACSLNMEVESVNVMLNKAFEWGLIVSHKIGKVPLLQENSLKIPRFLTRQEIAALRSGLINLE